MSLSSRIVQRGIATIREVEEALARQVLYGGDLVTNLLEVCRIDEGMLMPLVAEEAGLPNAPFGELPRATDAAQRMVAPEVALERAMAPLAMDDQEGLVVAVAEPLAKEDEQQLTFALAVPIAQQIAPLVRIRQALARDYGVPLDRRLERLLQRINDKGPGTESSFPPKRSAPAPAPPKNPPRPPSAAPPPMSRAPEPVARSTGTPNTLLRAVEAPPARPTKRRRGPLTLDVAKHELESAAERDTIFDLLFEFSRQFFDYTALFLVRDDVGEGRDAFGEGAPRELVARIGVPLDLPSLLAQARTQKTLVRGKGDPAGVDGVLAKDLARSGKTEWVIVPVVVRGRIVALLLGDGGDGGIDDAGLRDVQNVTLHCVSAFERMIVRRKLQGSVPPAPAGSGTGSRPPSAEPASQVPPTQVSEIAKRPSVEELAAPIRELVNESQASPSSDPKETTRQPTPEMTGLSTTKSGRPVPRSSSIPPPPNLLTVRRPSGAPIPREEPVSVEMAAVDPANAPAAPVAPPPSVTPPPRSKGSGLRRAIAPPLDFGPQPTMSTAFAHAPPIPPIGADDSERRLLAEIQGTPSAPATTRDAAPPAVTDPPPAMSEAPTSPKAESPPPPRPSTTTDPSPLSPFVPAPAHTLEIVDDGPTPMPEDATPVAPAVAPIDGAPVRVTSTLQTSPVSMPKPMPPSEQTISVAAHRPPSSRNDSARGLPSIIVDTTSEHVAYVERVLKGDDDEAEGELLRGGGAAMPAIMAKFPGPITVTTESLEGVMPRVGECGPILRLVAAQRRTAVPYVLALVDSDDVTKRFWATYLLTELVYPDAIDAAVRRVFDDEGRVRRAARAAARALAEVHPGAVVERLAPIAQDADGKKDARMLAIDALGETREPLAVAALIPVLSDKSSEIGAAARGALTTVTRQDFGTDAKKWETWWSQNKDRHRLEWLIDALVHEQAPLRAAAGEELKALSKEFYGYHDDLPKKEREKAQARYRDWWNSVGRIRFNRAARGA